MAASKRLKNADGVRGTHSKGNGPGPSGQALKTFVGDDDVVADRLAQKVTNRHTPEQTAANYASGDDTDERDSTKAVNYGLRDARDNAIQVLTPVMDDTDNVTMNAGGKSVVLVVGTSTTAAQIQSALRTLTGSTDVTVTGTDNAGPFTVTLGSRDAFDVTFTPPSDDATVTADANTPKYPIDALGETALTVIAGVSTDATGPSSGGIDVNYTIGSYTGVHVVITTNGDPNDVLFDGYEASSTPFRIEAADFIDGVGPGAGASVDVYVQGYKTTDPAANAAYSTFGPYAAKYDGTTV